MHERILNPFLLFKAAPNDMFSVFMNTSFNNALLNRTPKYANGDKTHAGTAVWCLDNPVVSESLADSTRQRPIAKKPSAQLTAMAAKKTPASACPRAKHAADDFVLVNNWDLYANNNANITTASALLLLHPIDDTQSVQYDTENETEFVFVDSE